MSTESDLLAAAAQHARATTVTPGRWIGLLRTQKNYPWRDTEWGRALLALEAVKNLPAPTPPAGLTLQRTIFWAGVTDDAVQHASRLGNTWRHALTADPAYAPTVAQVNALKAASAGVDAWGNQLEVTFTGILGFKEKWNLERFILQGETVNEYDSAMNLRANYLIGNPNAWVSLQRSSATEKIKQGNLAVTAEVYNGQPDTYSSQGVPVSSLTLGVAMDAGLHYPLADLLAKTPVAARATVCVWHGSGLEPADWAALINL